MAEGKRERERERELLWPFREVWFVSERTVPS